jgi:hypothetical protein
MAANLRTGNISGGADGHHQAQVVFYLNWNPPSLDWKIPVFGLLRIDRGYMEFETLDKQCWSYH